MYIKKIYDPKQDTTWEYGCFQLIMHKDEATLLQEVITKMRYTDTSFLRKAIVYFCKHLVDSGTIPKSLGRFKLHDVIGEEKQGRTAKK